MTLRWPVSCVSVSSEQASDWGLTLGWCNHRQTSPTACSASLSPSPLPSLLVNIRGLHTQTRYQHVQTVRLSLQGSHLAEIGQSQSRLWPTTQLQFQILYQWTMVYVVNLHHWDIKNFYYYFYYQIQTLPSIWVRASSFIFQHSMNDYNGDNLWMMSFFKIILI